MASFILSGGAANSRCQDTTVLHWNIFTNVKKKREEKWAQLRGSTNKPYSVKLRNAVIYLSNNKNCKNWKTQCNRKKGLAQEMKR